MHCFKKAYTFFIHDLVQSWLTFTNELNKRHFQRDKLICPAEISKVNPSRDFLFKLADPQKVSVILFLGMTASDQLLSLGILRFLQLFLFSSQDKLVSVQLKLAMSVMPKNCLRRNVMKKWKILQISKIHRPPISTILVFVLCIIIARLGTIHNNTIVW